MSVVETPDTLRMPPSVTAKKALVQYAKQHGLETIDERTLEQFASQCPALQGMRAAQKAKEARGGSLRHSLRSCAKIMTSHPSTWFITVPPR